ncbi:MAG: hypothetical protein HY675_24460 [Chloroflexi bacterium]|nr:hypothetical protein [Chloroflexota bacterium]
MARVIIENPIINSPYAEPTRHFRFSDEGINTIRPVYPTRADKCHVNYVVADTESWEQKMAQALEEMDEVVCYVKNHNLGFHHPVHHRRRGKELHPRFRRPPP